MVNDKKQSHHCHLCWCSTPAVLLRTVKLFPASDSRCSSLKHQRKYKSEKYSRSAQRNTVHSSLKRHKTDSLQSSVCDIGIAQIAPVAVNGWRATKVCGLSPSSLGAQMDPLLWPKHKVLKYKYNIPVTSWQCDWVFQEGWALILQCTFSYLRK